MSGRILSYLLLTVAAMYGGLGVFCDVYVFWVPHLASRAFTDLIIAVALYLIAMKFDDTMWIRPGPDDMVRH